MPTVSNAYKAARKDIRIKHGADIGDPIRWTIKNPDEEQTPYDFSNLSDIELHIYDYKGGSPVITPRPESSTEGLEVNVNVINWRDQWSSINLGRGSYYYEIIYQDSGFTWPGTPIVYGYMEIV